MRRLEAPQTQKVVLLNGPAGIGKTTVGRHLAATARNGVCIHGDDLRHFVVSRDLDTVQAGLSYVGGAALADVFLDARYDPVVFEFMFSRGLHVERFLRALRSEVPVHLLTLWAPLATVMEREAIRPNRERLGARVAECWHELAANLVELGVRIDARRPIDKVVRAAHQQVESGVALLGDDAVAA
jgi:chloramphenicol 3-O-phosphotransferase